MPFLQCIHGKRGPCKKCKALPQFDPQYNPMNPPGQASINPREYWQQQVERGLLTAEEARQMMGVTPSHVIYDETSTGDGDLLFGRKLQPGWRIDWDTQTVHSPGDIRPSTGVTFQLWQMHGCRYDTTVHCQVCGGTPDDDPAKPLQNFASPPGFALGGILPAAYDPTDNATAMLLNGEVYMDVPTTLQELQQAHAANRPPEGWQGSHPRPAVTSDASYMTWACQCDPRTSTFSVMHGLNGETWFEWSGRRNQGDPKPRMMPEGATISTEVYERLASDPSFAAPMCHMAWTIPPGAELIPPGLTPPWSNGTVAESTPSQEDDSLLTYVKHGRAKTPCKGCGQDDLIWAHEMPDGVVVSGVEADFCPRCKAVGGTVLCDPTPSPTGKYKPHSCVQAALHATAEGEGQGGSQPAETEAKPESDTMDPGDVFDPGERPDLQGPQSEDGQDPWLSTNMHMEPPGMPGCRDSEDGQHRVDENGLCTKCGEDQAGTPLPADPTDPTQGSGADSSKQEPPPWQYAESEGQGSSQNEGEFSDPEDPPSEYVLRTEWMEARKTDGQWLKNHTDELHTIVDRNKLHASAGLQRLQNDVQTRHANLAGLVRNETNQIKQQIKTTNRHVAELEERIGDGIIGSGPTTVTLVTPGRPDRPLPELHHKTLPTLVKLAHARLHVLMVGEAGVGKGKLARQVADALELPFYALPASLNPQTTVSQIIGYMQANGEYVRTLFRDAFEHGGVMFLDELDNAHPAAAACVNDAVAISPGDTIAFPDGMITKHEDFVVLAAANTFGRGPNQTYAARQRGDAATWDRFNIINTEIDDALEMTLCYRTGASSRTVAEVVRFVRSLRKNAAEKHKPVVLGMRATIDMCKMLNAGIDEHTAVDSRCRRGLSDQDWKAICGDVRDMELEPVTNEEDFN